MPERPYHILIIDDCPADRATYRRYLSKDKERRYVFAETNTVEEGLRLGAKFQPDCVLLDYKLPGLGGLDLLQLSRDGETPRNFAVIIITAHGNELVAVEAMKTGAQDYLMKSKLSEESLRKSVREAIDRIHRQRRLAQRFAELEKQAITDSLTGLLNRGYFLQRLEQELERVHRYNCLTSVLMVDIDHFKNINDVHGHLVGDNVLCHVARILRSSLRSSDLAGRYGGEEFCVLAANTDLEGASVFADRIRLLIAQQQFYGLPKDEPDRKLPVGSARAPSGFSVTCSIGLATATVDTPSVNHLLSRADEALYRAKREGRNRVCVAADDLSEVIL